MLRPGDNLQSPQRLDSYFAIGMFRRLQQSSNTRRYIAPAYAADQLDFYFGFGLWDGRKNDFIDVRAAQAIQAVAGGFLFGAFSTGRRLSQQLNVRIVTQLA